MTIFLYNFRTVCSRFTNMVSVQLIFFIDFYCKRARFAIKKMSMTHPKNKLFYTKILIKQKSVCPMVFFSSSSLVNAYELL